MRKYKAYVKTNIFPMEMEVNKALVPRSNVWQSERKHVRYTNYAPLNAPKSHILEEAQYADLILLP